MTGPKYFDNSATDLSFLRREHASGKLALASKSLISSFSHKSRHQLEARRETYPAVGPGNDDLAAFQRLAQDLQDLALELRQFVEEQHALVRQGDLARLRAAAAVT